MRMKNSNTLILMRTKMMVVTWKRKKQFLVKVMMKIKQIPVVIIVKMNKAVMKMITIIKIMIRNIVKKKNQKLIK